MKVFLIDYENVNEQGLSGVKELENGDIVNIFYSVNIKSMPFERSIELAQSRATIDSYLIKKTGKNYLDFQLTTLLGYLICKHEKADFFIVSKDTGFDSTVDFWKERKVSIARVTSIAGESTASIAEPEKAQDKEAKPKKEKASRKTRKSTAKTKKSKAEPEIIVEEPQVMAEVPEVKPAPAVKPAPVAKPAEKSIPKPALPEAYRKKVRVAVEGEKLAPNAYTGIYRSIVECKDKGQLNNELVKQFDSAKGGLIYGKIKAIYMEFQEEEAKRGKINE